MPPFVSSLPPYNPLIEIYQYTPFPPSQHQGFSDYTRSPSRRRPMTSAEAIGNGETVTQAVSGVCGRRSGLVDLSSVRRSGRLLSITHVGTYRVVVTYPPDRRTGVVLNLRFVIALSRYTHIPSALACEGEHASLADRNCRSVHIA